MTLKMNKVLVYVDDIPLYVPLQTTVIQACDTVGLHVPRFCYHSLLKIAGNCRICLIEVEKSPKPQVACSLPAINNIRIYTHSPIVKKAREGVLEFLLLNHPLDCPICDQGGECDLQNQAMKYGSKSGRFFKSKRGVEDTRLNPVVKTVITRCIHCTRCVRFAIDVAGVGDLGVVIRGIESEIGTYTSKVFVSEVSGNIIDLCPVGALTSKPHAYKTRPWEIKSLRTIDLTDCLGSHILLESKRRKLIRVVPRPCIEINEEWITDKARFVYEGLSKNRLAVSYYLKNSVFHPFSSWQNLNQTLEKVLQTQSTLHIIFGRNLDCETLMLGTLVCKKIGWDFTTENLEQIYPTIPCFFQSTSTLNNLETSDFCILIGINPRTEASLVNLRINKHTKAGKIRTVSLGIPSDLQYKVSDFGLHITHFLNLVLGKHTMSPHRSKQSIILYGDTLIKRQDAQSLLGFVLASSFYLNNSINTLRLPLGGNSTGVAFFGLSHPRTLVTYEEKTLKITYVVGLQDNILLERIQNKQKFIFENTHYKDLNYKPEFLVPIQSIYEKTGSFINYKGNLQTTGRLLRFVQKPLNFIKNFQNITDFLHAPNYTKSLFNSCFSLELQKLGVICLKLKCFTTPLQTLLGDIYLTDPATSASVTLIKISAIIHQSHWSFKQLQ